jgi:arylsulfatase A-like enzyme
MPSSTFTLGAALQSAGYRTALIGKWHLGATRGSGPEKFGLELYNLTEDIGEKNDLAAKYPDLVRQLRAKLGAQSVLDSDVVPN